MIGYKSSKHAEGRGPEVYKGLEEAQNKEKM